MSNRLTHSLRPLRLLLRAPLGRAGGTPHRTAPAVPAARPQALEQTRELDARTSWPTHRIRNFLSSRTAL
ncbi:hypothetical protein [Comamonas guangdongensis]|uniref:Uncharacterized protein n=1 Tax=Comamonas guangdongensis TaxID=510515 RepID=A0ABV3ZT26_9BURK